VTQVGPEVIDPSQSSASIKNPLTLEEDTPTNKLDEQVKIEKFLKLMKLDDVDYEVTKYFPKKFEAL